MLNSQSTPVDLCEPEDKQLERRSTMMIRVVGFMTQKLITGEESIIREVIEVVTMMLRPLQMQETRSFL